MSSDSPSQDSLNQSFNASFTQTMNQGMGAVGDAAADIEIYMGDQAEEMGKDSRNSMSGGTGLGGSTQPPPLMQQQEGEKTKEDEEESK